MKILALSDQVDEVIYSTHISERLWEIELIVGCGDLPADYLEFVVSMLDVPLIYVPGNHDRDEYTVPGGIGIDGKLVNVCNLNVAGLGGSRRYKSRGRHQYTEAEMTRRVLRMLLSAYVNLSLRNRKLDIFISHSPPCGIHDAPDLAHCGFKAFHTLLKYLKPVLMLHGHSHVHRNIECTETVIESTKIINVFPHRIVEFERLP